MYEKPPSRRPYRWMSETGPVLTVQTDTSRLYLRQVGWIGQSGAFYSLDETHTKYERGGVAPLYFPAHSDRLADLAPDNGTEVQLSNLVADGLREELTKAQDDVALLLKLISKNVVAANDFGGTDLNDLVGDVVAKGFTLPDGEEAS